MNEMDILELGFRAAMWWSAAADCPHFMLAREILRERGPRKRAQQ